MPRDSRSKTNFKMSDAAKKRLKLLKVTKDVTIQEIVSAFVEEWIDAAERTIGVLKPLVIVVPGIMHRKAEPIAAALEYFTNRLLQSLPEEGKGDKNRPTSPVEEEIKKHLTRVADAIASGGKGGKVVGSAKEDTEALERIGSFAESEGLHGGTAKNRSEGAGGPGRRAKKEK